MNVDYARMCYIFYNAIEKSLQYMPKIPETSIGRYLLEWSLYETKDIFSKGIPNLGEGQPEIDPQLLDFQMLFAADEQNFDGFEALIDYDYFDDPSEDLSGIDLTGFFPDDKPRRFQYRYGPQETK